MSLPSFETEPAESPELVKALGVNASDVRWSAEAKKLLVRVGSEQELLEMSPDIEAMLAARDMPEVRGVIVTASLQDSLGGAAPHFVSRYFAPWVGIAEDPVTGSAHAVLGPYWSARLGRKKLLAAQRSPRGGEMGVEIRAESVVLTGSCVTLSRGMMQI
jgi:PhzF family phenazine biosynthesis protein